MKSEGIKAIPLLSPASSVADEPYSLRISLLLAALATLLRPTNAIVWASIGTLLLTRLTLDGVSPITTSAAAILVREVVSCGSLVLVASLISDKLFFGHWVFPPYKFLHFNLVQSLAVFYGQSDWHYYLSQGIPLLSFGALPFVIVGIWKSTSSGLNAQLEICTANVLRTLGFASLSLFAALSLVPHKEARFIYPLLPIFHILAAPHVVSYLTQQATEVKPPSKGKTISRKGTLTALMAINIVVGGYLSYFHAASPIAVLSFLRHEWETRHPKSLNIGVDSRLSRKSRQFEFPDLEQGGNQFVVFLVPCHTSPWRSHLVYPSLTARALTCEPPLDTLSGSEERRSYQDEMDIFYANITEFLGMGADERWSLGWDGRCANEFGSLSVHDALPTFIVGFDGIEDELHGYFDSGYGKGWGVRLEKKWSMWNGFFSDDWKREGWLIAWEVVTQGGGTSGGPE